MAVRGGICEQKNVKVKNAMFRILRHILLFMFLAMQLAGCHESYPALYMEEMADDGINAENGETSRVPIVPSLSDPQYEIYTRGHGPFNSFDQDMEHWTNADFHTYALLTGNRFSAAAADGQVNYAATDENHRLLWDQTMRLKDGGGGVAFFDASGEVSRYYSTQHQDWRYNFFTFYADDCVLEPAVADASANTVTVGLTIDGKQDVMHATAYHTDEDFMEALRKLQEMDGYGDGTQSADDKPLIEYGNELLYSTMSGHRAVQPIFRLNHLLTQLQFFIRGAKAPNASTAAIGSTDANAPADELVTVEGYQQLVVRNVSVRVPTQGRLTVAKDEWADPARYEQDLQDWKLLQFDAQTKNLEPDMKMVPPTDFYTALADDEKYERWLAGTDKMFHITSTKIDTLTRPILLPPSDKFEVELQVDFFHIPSQDGTLREDIREIGPITYNVMLKDQKFEPGHSYAVVISVYGPQIINGELQMKAWVGGNEAFVGRDVNQLDDDVRNSDRIVFVGGDDDENNQGAEDQIHMDD